MGESGRRERGIENKRESAHARESEREREREKERLTSNQITPPLPPSNTLSPPPSLLMPSFLFPSLLLSAYQTMSEVDRQMNEIAQTRNQQNQIASPLLVPGPSASSPVLSDRSSKRASQPVSIGSLPASPPGARSLPISILPFSLFLFSFLVPSLHSLPDSPICVLHHPFAHPQSCPHHTAGRDCDRSRGIQRQHLRKQ